MVQYGGDVVGTSSAGTSLEEALTTASAEEVIPTQLPVEDGEGNQFLVDAVVHATVDADGDGLQWRPVMGPDADAVCHRVVSMSQMTSMLHDTHRNDLYFAAIRAAVKSYRARTGSAPVVLDIGAGTGLLSLMASKAGAEAVYAAEMFGQMAAIAKDVTAANTGAGHPSDVGRPMCDVHVVAKKSTVMSAGSAAGDDMPAAAAHIVVTEVFDSVLLGEGILPSLRHARDNLVAPGAVVVPHAGQVFGQLVSCPAAQSFRATDTTRYRDGGLLARKGWLDSCMSGAHALPMHVNQLQPPPTPLSAPFEVFAFDFQHLMTDATYLPAGELVSHSFTVPTTSSGTVHAVVLWWDLSLSDATYTTNPAVPPGVWQDHWCPAVLPLGCVVDVAAAGDEVELLATRNDFNVRFKARLAAADVESEAGAESGAGVDASAGAGAGAGRTDPAGGATSAAKRKRRLPLEPDPAVCVCGLHAVCNWQRLSMLNDDVYMGTLRTAMDATVAAAATSAPPSSTLVVVDVADGAVAGFLAATCPLPADSTVAVRVLSAQCSPEMARHCQLVAGDRPMTFACSHLSDLDVAAAAAPSGDGDGGGDSNDGRSTRVGVVCGEPFFGSMQNLVLWSFASLWLRLNVACKSAPDAAVVPARGSVVAAVVQLDDLWRSHGKADVVSGFNHAALDAYQVDWHVTPYPYPLWMYPHMLLSAATDIVTADFSTPLTSHPAATAPGGVRVQLPVTSAGTAHAVVWWTRYELTPGGSAISTGLQYHAGSGRSHGMSAWKQSVLFLAGYPAVEPGSHAVDVTLQLEPTPVVTAAVTTV